MRDPVWKVDVMIGMIVGMVVGNVEVDIKPLVVNLAHAYTFGSKPITVPELQFQIK